MGPQDVSLGGDDVRTSGCRHWIAVGLAAGLVSGLVGCGGDSGDGTAEKADRKITRITACTHVPFEPMELEGDGPRGLKYTGFDIELLDAMAEDLGATLAVEAVGEDELVDGVRSGSCDVIASAFNITAERRDQVDFTDPYFDAKLTLLLRTDFEGTSLDDLAGSTIGTRTGSTSHRYLEGRLPEGAKLQDFATTQDMIDAIGTGRIDGILQELVVNAAIVNENPTLEVVQSFDTAEQYGFAVKKGDDLAERLNEALQQVRDDGLYDRLYVKYFRTAP